jgi:hypothetical protein
MVMGRTLLDACLVPTPLKTPNINDVKSKSSNHRSDSEQSVNAPKATRSAVEALSEEFQGECDGVQLGCGRVSVRMMSTVIFIALLATLSIDGAHRGIGVFVKCYCRLIFCKNTLAIASNRSRIIKFNSSRGMYRV